MHSTTVPNDAADRGLDLHENFSELQNKVAYAVDEVAAKRWICCDGDRGGVARARPVCLDFLNKLGSVGRIGMH
jgi:hypothetical protein